MRWKVEGADELTGTERRLVVEARDRDEAERKARYGGLLVASVEADAAPALDYAGPAPPQTEAPRLLTPPTYRGILRWDLVLRVVAVVLLLTAAACFVLAGFAFVAGTRFAVGVDAWLAGAGAAVTPAVLGALLAAAAAALRMLGEIGKAVRDVARNSFDV